MRSVSCSRHEDADLQRRQVGGEQVVGATVKAILGQQMIARTEQRQHRSRNRRHPAPRHQRRLGILERRQLAMQYLVIGRVAQPDVAEVVVALLAAIGEGRRLENRHRHCAADPRVRLAGMD